MAEATTKEQRKPTIETALRNSAARFARNSALLEEGVSISRKAMVLISEAESHYGNALLLLRHVDSMVAGEFGFEGAKQILARRIAAIEIDIASLVATRMRISGYQEGTLTAMGQMDDYVRDSVSGVFGPSLAKRSAKPAAAGGRTDFAMDLGPCEAKPQEFRFHEITVAPVEGSVEQSFDADLATFRSVVAILEGAAECTFEAGRQMSGAVAGMTLAANKYHLVSESICIGEGSPAAPTMRAAKTVLDATSKDAAQVSKELKENTAGQDARDDIGKVIKAIEKAVGDALSMAMNPATATPFLKAERIRQTIEAVSEGTTSAALEHIVHESGDADALFEALKALANSGKWANAIGALTDIAKDENIPWAEKTALGMLETYGRGEELAPEMATDASLAAVAGLALAKTTRIQRTAERVGEGRTHEAANHIARYEGDTEALFSELVLLVPAGKGVNLVKALDEIVKDERTGDAGRKAAEMLTAYSRGGEGVPGEVSEAALAALVLVSAPKEEQ